MIAIPAAAPHRRFERHRHLLTQAFAEQIDAGQYILGGVVQQFEQAFAQVIQAQEAVGVANGTDALELALRAVGVGAGDLVVTVSHTAVATATAIRRSGAEPRFVDVDENGQIDTSALSRTMAAVRPAALVVVPLYGAPPDMGEVQKIAQRHQVPVVCDAAQAHGALFDGRPLTAFCAAASYSFYPTKNLGIPGDGGAVCSDDPKIATRVRALRQYGWDEQRISHETGMNSRLDSAHAALLLRLLPFLAADNQRRRNIAARFDEALRGSRVRPLAATPKALPVYHQYVVRSDARNRLSAYLHEHGIGTLVHYATPCHRQPAYCDESLLAVGPLTVTESLCNQILSIPVYPELTDTEVGMIADALHRFR